MPSMPVAGGWSTETVAEHRLATPTELIAAAPDPPAIVTHLYRSAAMSHVSIDAVLRFGPLMDLARETAVDADFLEIRGDLAERRPIDALRPGNAPLWLFDDEGSLAAHGERIMSDLETLAVDPLLLAAAVILTDGSYERAWDVLKRHYPDGSRASEVYRGATDYVAAQLGQNECEDERAQQAPVPAVEVQARHC
jgi:hypothetical protein